MRKVRPDERRSAHGPDAGQARPRHGRRQRPLDRLGHRQGPRRARRRARLHLPGRGARQARRAARRSRSARTLVLPCDVEDIALGRRGLRRARPATGAGSTSSSTPSPSRTRTSSRAATPTPRGRTSRARMVISCFSFTEVAKRAAALMPNGGSMITLTYGGSTRVMPNYNVMGVAKAALEASVRYLAADFGAARHPRQRDLGRADAHARRRRHRRRAADVLLSRRRTRRLRRTRLARGDRRLGALSAVRPVAAASPARSTTSIPATTSSRCRARRC